MRENESDKMMVATARVTVLPKSRKEFFQTITPLAQRISREKGCLNCGVYEESGDENSLVLIEEWAAEGYWNDHRKGDNFAVLFGLLNVVSIPSKIDFKLLQQVGDNVTIKADNGEGIKS